MAVVEVRESRKITMTTHGQELTAIFKCTWSEWDAADADLPYIGRVWINSRGPMWCTQIKAETMPGAIASSSGPCLVTATFSTEGNENRQKRENQVTSWQESISGTLAQENVDVYYDVLSSTYKDWATAWTDDGNTTDPPALVHYVPQGEWNITLYGSRLYMNRFTTALGCVNSVPFAVQYAAAKSAACGQFNADTSTWDDTDLWLLAGVSCRPVREGVYQYDLHLLGKQGGGGWNTDYGIDTNQYVAIDFATLFAGMNMNEPEEDMGLHG